ncbi:MAG: hypothetical protein Q7U04_07775, partial [Bacteriovorax sp.]|nr:hypothetical protein [Bacteriovorax sp.]
MLLKKMATLILALSISSCSGLKNQNNSSRFSQRDDQYWANLVQLSIDSKTSILSIIHTQNPSLSNQIVSDSKDPLLLSFWGKSLNFDSGAKKKILDD